MGKSPVEVRISKVRHARAQMSLFSEGGNPKHISGAKMTRVFLNCLMGFSKESLTEVNNAKVSK